MPPLPLTFRVFTKTPWEFTTATDNEIPSQKRGGLVTAPYPTKTVSEPEVGVGFVGLVPPPQAENITTADAPSKVMDAMDATTESCLMVLDIQAPSLLLPWL
jgi:hypothetical protein